MPLTCAQLAVNTYDFFASQSLLYILEIKEFTMVRLPEPTGPWKIIFGILPFSIKVSSLLIILPCISRDI
jgi:hypothetical protein